MLAIVGFWFTAQQDTRQQRIEDKRAQQAQKIENQRAESERELAVQRAQDEALQAYLDQISGLLLERDLRTSEKGSEVRTLARARTLTVLSRLDGKRKARVVQFLYEAGLISKSKDQVGDPIILLTGADLRGVQLYGTYLRGIVLRTYPAGRGIPTKSFLVRTDLRDANLGSCNLQDAELGLTDLDGANLDFTSLDNANLYQAYLREASLRGARLSDTNFTDAFMEGANLNGAEGKTSEQLEQQHSGLNGATMPNGQKYEK